MRIAVVAPLVAPVRPGQARGNHALLVDVTRTRSCSSSARARPRAPRRQTRRGSTGPSRTSTTSPSTRGGWRSPRSSVLPPSSWGRGWPSRTRITRRSIESCPSADRWPSCTPGRRTRAVAGRRNRSRRSDAHWPSARSASRSRALHRRPRSRAAWPRASARRAPPARRSTWRAASHSAVSPASSPAPPSSSPTTPGRCTSRPRSGRRRSGSTGSATWSMAAS